MRSAARDPGILVPLRVAKALHRPSAGAPDAVHEVLDELSHHTSADVRRAALKALASAPAPTSNGREAARGSDPLTRAFRVGADTSYQRNPIARPRCGFTSAGPRRRWWGPPVVSRLPWRHLGRWARRPPSVDAEPQHRRRHAVRRQRRDSARRRVRPALGEPRARCRSGQLPARIRAGRGLLAPLSPPPPRCISSDTPGEGARVLPRARAKGSGRRR